jgi:hypothetical protein
VNLALADGRRTPVLAAGPPLLNTQVVHQPYAPG